MLPIYNLNVGSIFSVLLRKAFFMENSYANLEPFGNHLTEINKIKTGLTPRELINYHMNNPDVPISDEDIENLVLDTTIVPENEDAPVDTITGAADN